MWQEAIVYSLSSQCTSSICGNLRFIFKCLCGRDARAAEPSAPLSFASIQHSSLSSGSASGCHPQPPAPSPLSLFPCHVAVCHCSNFNVALVNFAVSHTPSLAQSSPANIATQPHLPHTPFWLPLMLFPVISPHHH